MPMHIGCVAIFDGAMSFDRFVESLSSRMHTIPRYRQRLAFVPFNLSHPTWEDDPDFDIRNHVSHIRLPEPGAEAQLRAIAGRLFAEPLDRSKPMWEIVLIEGLEGNRTGALMKVHHCLVDGVSGVDLLVAILDLTPEPPPASEPPPFRPDPLPEPARLLSDAFWEEASAAWDWWTNTAVSSLDPGRSTTRFRDTVNAVNAVSSALSRPIPMLPFNRPLSTSRKVGWVNLSFAETRAIRASMKGTINDVVLATLAGALRRYLLRHDVAIDGTDARVMIPVNVRTEDQSGALGNRVSMMLADIPIGEPDPRRRFETIRRRMDELKSQNQASAMSMVADLLGRLPVPLQANLGTVEPVNTAINLVCTNVPGPQIPLYSIGHPLLAYYPLVNLAYGMGLGVAIMTYNGRLLYGVHADAHAVPDAEVFEEALADSFAELREIAGVEPLDVPAAFARQSEPAEAVREPTA